MKELLTKLGIEDRNPGAFGKEVYGGGERFLDSYSPIDQKKIASVAVATEEQYELVIQDAVETFKEWRQVPAPQRGELVREINIELRQHRDDLGKLVTLEMGKILAEGVGEVQEAIDIGDLAVGLSRQMYGKTMRSERPQHRMYEQWHPLGVVGVITAFNFPAAVWAWNALIASVCGDVIVWKPSEVTPLTSLAMNNIARRVATKHGFPALFSLIIGDGPEHGKKIAADKRIPLVSATGSCEMGRSVAQTVGARLGRSLLELGGNNAVILEADAELQHAIPSIVFGAVGTAGQRCTSTRRVLVHKSIAKKFTETLLKSYKTIQIGNPLDEGILLGPMATEAGIKAYEEGIKKIKEQGGEILCGAEVLSGYSSNLFVAPTVVKAKKDMPMLKEETFAPILYIVEVDSYEEAIEIHNDVPQGLSSAIFTQNLRTAERFLSVAGSDCGISNVNIGTSGAEVGGAFGGEKDTGGGRESGSDAWRQYMRRQTNTINFNTELPLAQGVKFDLNI